MDGDTPRLAAPAAPDGSRLLDALTMLQSHDEETRRAGVQHINAYLASACADESVCACVWECARRMLMTPTQRYLDPALARWRTMGPRCEAYFLTLALFPKYKSVLMRDPLFWRATYFGLRQGDELRKVALSLLRSIIDTWRADAAASASASALDGVPPGISVWERFYEVMGVLEDFPAHLVKQVQTQIDELFFAAERFSGVVYETVTARCPSDVHTVATAEDSRELVIALPPRAWYDEAVDAKGFPGNNASMPYLPSAMKQRATLVHDDPATADHVDAGFLSPAHLPTPSPAGLPIEWACAVLDRALSHDHPGVRRSFLYRLMGVDGDVAPWLPAVGDPLQTLRGHAQGTCLHAAYGVSASSGAGCTRTFSPHLVLRLPPWYVASPFHLFGRLAEAEVSRGLNDVFGPAVSQYLTTYVDLLARGDAYFRAADGSMQSTTRAFLTAVLQAESQIPSACAHARSVLRGLAAAAWHARRWQFLFRTAGPMVAVLDTTGMEYLRVALCSLGRFVSREVMAERCQEALALMLGAGNANEMSPSALSLFLASMPAAIVAGLFGTTDDDDRQCPVTRWLAPAAESLLGHLRAAIRAYVTGTSAYPELVDSRTCAVGIARLLVLMPRDAWGPEYERFVDVCGPWLDSLASMHTSSCPNAFQRSRSVRLLLALMTQLEPWAVLADSHAFVGTLDLLPAVPTLESPLAAEFFLSMRAITVEAAWPDDLPAEYIAHGAGVSDSVYASAARARSPAQPTEAYAVAGDAAASTALHRTHAFSATPRTAPSDVSIAAARLRDVSLLHASERCGHFDGVAQMVHTCVIAHPSIVHEVAGYLQTSCEKELAAFSEWRHAPSSADVVFSWECGLQVRLPHASHSVGDGVPLDWRLRLIGLCARHARAYAADAYQRVQAKLLEHSLRGMHAPAGMERSIPGGEATSAVDAQMLPTLSFLQHACVLAQCVKAGSTLATDLRNALERALQMLVVHDTRIPPNPPPHALPLVIRSGDAGRAAVNDDNSMLMSWATFRVLVEGCRWGAFAATLHALQADADMNTAGAKGRSALAGLPPAVADELAASVLNALQSTRDEYVHAILSSIAPVLEACLSEHEDIADFQAACAVAYPHRDPSALPITSIRLEEMLQAMRIAVHPCYGSFQVVQRFVACCTRMALFLRPALHAWTPSPDANVASGPSCLRSHLHQMFDEFSDTKRAPLHMQEFAGVLVCRWRVLLQMAEQAEAESPEALSDGKSLEHSAKPTAKMRMIIRSVLLSYVPLMTSLLLHAEAVPVLEDPLLQDINVRLQLRRWLQQEDAQGSLPTDNHPMWRGGGAVTRLYALCFADEVGQRAARARAQELAAIRTGSGHESSVRGGLAVTLHRALLLRLLRASVQPRWSKEDTPGTAMFRAKTRCWQAIGVLLRTWGATDGAQDLQQGGYYVAGGSLIFLPKLDMVLPRSCLDAGGAAARTAGINEFDVTRYDSSTDLTPLLRGLTSSDAFAVPLAAAQADWSDGFSKPAARGSAKHARKGASVHATQDVERDAMTMRAVQQDTANIPDDVVAIAAAHCAAVTNMICSSRVRRAVEQAMVAIGRRFPFVVVSTFSAPALQNFEARAVAAFSAMYIVNFAVATSVHCVRALEHACTADGSLPPDVNPARAAAAFKSFILSTCRLATPWCMSTVGVLRTQAVGTLLMASRGLFPHWFNDDGVIPGTPAMPAAEYEHAWLHGLMAFTTNARDAKRTVLDAQAIMEKANPELQNSLAELLAYPVDEYGEFVPFDVTAEIKESYSTVCSRHHVEDPYGQTDIQIFNEDAPWLVRAGLLPRRAAADDRLRVGYDPITNTLPQQMCSPATTSQDGIAAFNFQRNVLSVLDAAHGPGSSDAGADSSQSASAAATATSGAVELPPVLPLASNILTSVVESGRRCQPLIVMAALLDKATNIGGLARTCEIFGAQSLVVPKLSVVDDPSFKDVAVGAGKWMTLHECPATHMVEYLRQRRAQGYTIVGLEQAARSKALQHFAFPDHVVLVLGAELLGMPAEVIQELDVCVEIPQMGLIRSLNVHVSASLMMWEYTRQRICRLK